MKGEIFESDPVKMKRKSKHNEEIGNLEKDHKKRESAVIFHKIRVD